MMKPGTLIGDRYLIVERVGSGGMQDVFRATDTVLSRDIALKTPQAGQATKRFGSSAKIAARINHHNVAKTYDYFEHQGAAYMIEELVEGEDLEGKLKAYEIIDPHLAAHILFQLAKGVAASHHAGVVHRDLKPSNVLVSEGPNVSFLKITDFGIATLTGVVFDEAAQSGDLTRSTSGTVKGALPYMAPEMMFRKPGEHPGPASDIWSLGAMMFRLLTGIYPFGVFLEAAVNVKNQSREAWPAFMTANAQFAPLSNELQSLVESCLQYIPKDRPSADDIVQTCNKFCYQCLPRYEGVVTNLIQHGHSGFIDGQEGRAFFPMDSVYGPKRPAQGGASKVFYSAFPGTPHPRAHPVIVVN